MSGGFEQWGWRSSKQLVRIKYMSQEEYIDSFLHPLVLFVTILVPYLHGRDKRTFEMREDVGFGIERK